MKFYLIIIPVILVSKFYAFSLTEKNSISPIENSHYKIHLTIDPLHQSIKVDGLLNFLIESDSISEFSFLLHKNLKINSFTFNNSNKFSIDSTYEPARWQPDAIKLIYNSDITYQRGEVVNIEFNYEGKITSWPSWSANVIDTNWIEMGLYLPWYPNFYGLFTYNLNVTIDPEYAIFALGEHSKNGESHNFKNQNPIGDFVVCASKDLVIYNANIKSSTIKLVNSHLSKQTSDLMLSDIEKIYNNYLSWFGEINEMEMNIIVSKRIKGGGYARKRALYLGGINDSSYTNKRIDYYRYLSHELAHFWWNGADHNWEDWLNESFAEYSAAIQIRETFGIDDYNIFMNKKEAESIDLPPIWEMNRNDPKAEKLLYSKGVLILKKLEDKISQENFRKLCQDRFQNNINETNSFLNLLHKNEGIETEEWFRELLKK
jgi:hypothetical protein